MDGFQRQQAYYSFLSANIQTKRQQLLFKKRYIERLKQITKETQKKSNAQTLYLKKCLKANSKSKHRGIYQSQRQNEPLTFVMVYPASGQYKWLLYNMSIGNDKYFSINSVKDLLDDIKFKTQTNRTKMQIPNTRTIDVPVETLFTKFDRENEGNLTRLQIAQILTDIFKSFGLNNAVTKEDVENFLIDYDIHNKGDLTRKDFEGITKLRFVLRESSININASVLKVSLPQALPQIRQIIVPVTMLFDIFSRRRDGHLTRLQIGQVINLIFKDFNMPYQVNEFDIQNFLQDFDINNDHQITLQDFKGVDVLHFDIHHNMEMRVY